MEGLVELKTTKTGNGNTTVSNRPEWWLAGQQQAKARYEALPMPKRKDEAWRFASVQNLDLAPYQPAVSVSDAERARILEASVMCFEAAGHAVFANDQLLSFQGANDELQKKGVIFEPISEALAKHPELLKKHFMEQPVVLGSEKFAALHRAQCNNGILLYVPKNVQVKLPLAAWHWLSGANGAVFPHTLIIAEANSEVTFTDFYRSLDEQPGLAVSVTDLLVGDGAKVNYLCCQSWSEQALSFQLCSTLVGKDAYAKSLNFNLGGIFSRIESHSRLAGTGARSEMLGLSVCHGKQEFDQRTLQDHLAPNAWSDLLYKNALNHRAKSIFEGLIKVEVGAKQTDAYQTNRNLLLSGDAEADSMPGLEIANDDVKCSHGATTGQISSEELFYMLQRGIPRHEANYLISVGFTEEVLERFGNAEINEQLREMIADKFRRGKNVKVEAAGDEAIDETNVRSLQGTV
jgi:Fe-S cluster assembly protein SufD